MSDYTLHCGDVLTVLGTLPAESVQTCVTSPPYFGLRDYGTATWQGGDAACDHKPEVKPRTERPRSGLTGGLDYMEAKDPVYRDLCGKCGARRVDQQIGLEDTPEAYVAKLVDVFREVRRVLRDDGTVFLNLGDSYYGSGGAGGDYGPGGLKEGQPKYPGRNVGGLKPKDLIGIPWMCAFALRADGWWLRSEIIWHKRAPMPESVTDRPTKAHEQVFLLSKAATYFYDADAIREPNSETSQTGGQYRNEWKYTAIGHGSSTSQMRVGEPIPRNGRNKRSVWTLSPEHFDAAHFATMPTKLVEPCILAGSSQYGACSVCLAPWERVVEREGIEAERRTPSKEARAMNGQVDRNIPGGYSPKVTTLGWAATCQCGADVVPCTILDCFNGAATTGIVALKYGRKYIGIELNPDYIKLSEERLNRTQPMLLDVTA